LPSSCQESSQHLKQEADFYQKDGVFPAGTIENFVKKLGAFEDENLNDKLLSQKDEVKKLVDRYLHCM